MKKILLIDDSDTYRQHYLAEAENTYKMKK